MYYAIYTIRASVSSLHSDSIIETFYVTHVTRISQLAVHCFCLCGLNETLLFEVLVSKCVP